MKRSQLEDYLWTINRLQEDVWHLVKEGPEYFVYCMGDIVYGPLKITEMELVLRRKRSEVDGLS